MHVGVAFAFGDRFVYFAVTPVRPSCDSPVESLPHLEANPQQHPTDALALAPVVFAQGFIRGKCSTKAATENDSPTWRAEPEAPPVTPGSASPCDP